MRYVLNKKLTIMVTITVAAFVFYNYFFIRSDPQTQIFDQRMNTQDKIVVLLSSNDKESSKRLVDNLAIEIRKLSPSILNRLEYEQSADVAFFKQHMPLYVSLEDLNKIHQFLKDSLQFEKDLFSPLSIFQGKPLKKPFIDLEALVDKYTQIKPFKKFPGNYFVSEDETKRALLISPQKGSDIPSLKDEVRKITQRIDLSYYASDLRVKTVDLVMGDKETVTEEEKNSIKEIFGSTLRPIILMASSEEKAKVLAARLKQTQELNRLFVKTFGDYYPNQQIEKVNTLKKIKNIFTPKVLNILSDEEKSGVAKFLKLDAFEPFSKESLPPSILSRFIEKDGTFGKVVYVDSSNGVSEKNIELIKSIAASVDATITVFSF